MNPLNDRFLHEQPLSGAFAHGILGALVLGFSLGVSVAADELEALRFRSGAGMRQIV